ncbi:ketopantoate reductase C-terminal domain-containing protein [uncultured Pseudomonas sp.]|uniref:ketopantoate reductase C-terminal domain-containing protein n=1 Tax=uncultured Pseudomonas sp. TaxID=114707 RepID=UPI0025DB62ED|nr:ketopantoate reductase C-terminal domain-containing protein [uncultured Pseudomonas sp.]
MALTQRRAGMYARSDISRLSLAYLQECLAVARAEGANLRDDVPQAILDQFQAFPSDVGTSTLTDREANRPLEWDIRNGVVSRYGRADGNATPNQRHAGSTSRRGERQPGLTGRWLGRVTTTCTLKI